MTNRELEAANARIAELEKHQDTVIENTPLERKRLMRAICKELAMFGVIELSAFLTQLRLSRVMSDD